MGQVVVSPRRAFQPAQTEALGERLFRAGVGVDEDVAVVESGHQADAVALEHAVAEHIARHVTDARNRHCLSTEVDAKGTEMSAGRSPGASGGYAQGLVVVTAAASRSKGVPQPKAPGNAYVVGFVGKV